MSSRKTNNLLQIICSVFIFLFVYTALSKFQDLDTFQSVLRKLPFIGKRNPAILWILPLTELMVAFLLFLPRTRRLGLYGSFSLMFLFTIYVGLMISFAPHLPCSCGGVIKQMSWKQHLTFNTFFTALALFGIWLSRRQQKDLLATIDFKAKHSV